MYRHRSVRTAWLPGLCVVIAGRSRGADASFNCGTRLIPSNPVFGGRYFLTTKEGLAYEIDGVSGDLRTVSDNTGNVLSFSQNGIASSTGKSVTFERDPQGRIMAVVDPMGERIRYEYGAHGDLITVTDRTGNSTRFEYRTDRPHLIYKICYIA